ncbi:hypothetical protein [Amnibacterium kyonggiense]|uniref:Uncharacterized protein n=1 Tax=Amnibacterium kyonggiense TaxID=595671 RepID=A0A4R7FPZ7_9MICO|nr:hypothetical protein [Amnibacterium kyonggiense]TDS79793.1 hypothetical protein CLV52_0335 [Amnibacterium kyonggiense]
MSTFDPETGFRAVPPALQVDGVVRRVRNPYDAALGIIWASAGTLTVLLLFIGAGLQQTPTGGGGCFALSGVLAVIALLVGSIHLGVRAIGWRPPQD